MDAPGPWGTGPFILSKGYSSIYNVQAMWKTDPFTSTWLTTSEERTPFVVLKANNKYWNTERGPRLDTVVFRNDINPKEALHLCTTTEGQVDIVTQVVPEDAQKVIASNYAKLVVDYGDKVVAGVFNRFKSDINFDDRKLRLALNLAVDRDEIIRKCFLGYADVVPALTPPWAFDFPEELRPRQYNPAEARQLLKEVGWPKGRRLQIAATRQYGKVAYLMASQIERALLIGVDVVIIPPNEELKWARVVAEKRLIPNWDILLSSATAFFYEATPAFFHREFFGFDGALRSGPEIPRFDELYNTMASRTDQKELLQASKNIDRYVYEEALGLFLCSPQNLYAVNRHVKFRPYRTTFELAETEVTQYHWSRLSNYGTYNGRYSV